MFAPFSYLCIDANEVRLVNLQYFESAEHRLLSKR